MKITFLLVITFIALNVEAKKKKSKHAVTSKKHQVAGPFRLPVFAIRMPIFGAQELVRPSAMVFNDAPAVGPNNEKLKTVTKTSKSTNGPYKTYTVVSETKSANPSNPKVYRKVIKSFTTMHRNSSSPINGTSLKLPTINFMRMRFTNPLFKLLPNLGGEDKQNDEVAEKDCSDAKPCKGSGEYCDKFFGVCKDKVLPYGACSQKDQCSTSKGAYQCTWGRCVKGAAGEAGTFCDKPTDCQSGKEELGCFNQNDISRYSKVCVPKLGEGSTCGRSAGIFDMFESDDDDQRCQGNLVCRAVGFFGRKACIRDVAQDQHDYIASIKKNTKGKTKHKKH